MKILLFTLCVLLYSYRAHSQTLKIAHKSHSGNMNSFVVSRSVHNLGLSPSQAEKMQAAKERKRDSLEKIYLAKKKQDSIKKAENKKPKNSKKEIKKEDLKPEKTSQNNLKPLYKTVSISPQTASLAYPVGYEANTENAARSWVIMLMSILPAFVVLYWVLHKIRLM